MGERLFWLSDRQRARIEPHLPSGLPGPARDDDRRITSGIINMLQSGAHWRDCPPEYGPASRAGRCLRVEGSEFDTRAVHPNCRTLEYFLSQPWSMMRESDEGWVYSVGRGARDDERDQ